LAAAESVCFRPQRGDAMTAAERTFTLVFTESDLTKIVAALWREEHRQLFLARMADTQGRSKEAEARRASAGAAQALSERLSIIGAEI
jgi:hypothetical protein